MNLGLTNPTLIKIETTHSLSY